MALPTAYLTTTKNVDAILTAIKTAEAPQKFNRMFLENLGFKSSGDRLIINVLKALGFLASDGTPTERYVRYLDQTQSGQVLAEGIREAYADLFQLNREAETMGRTELKNKIKTLRQGKGTDAVLLSMAKTFEALVKEADFSQASPDAAPPAPDGASNESSEVDSSGPAIGLAGLTYAVHLQLPESRDPKVYDALFRSLRTHLLT